MQYNHELDRYRIEHRKTLRNCMYGGKGEVCLVAPSGKGHTYRFSKPRNSEQFPGDVIFVSVLHDGQPFYIGMIEKQKFRLTQNSRFEEDCESVKGAKYLMDMVNSDAFFEQSPMKVFHNGRCSVCGRSLDSERSIRDGIGKRCFAKPGTQLRFEHV